MKLFPPQDELELYVQGFGDSDLFGRKPAGQRLSELLERVEDSVVVALDGPWGSGKSHFLKRWAGAHAGENGGAATTVYFDAFENDYLEDPLVGLISAIGDRLPSGEQSRIWKAAKTVVAKLGRPAFRILAAAVTKGASEFVGPAIDAALDASSKEADKAAEAFWRREEGRKAAKKQFEGFLVKLTLPIGETGEELEPKPLIIIVDELDRCRPDYALSVLEVIKHFFAVPHVHFVLGVNLDALEHMVRGRYGAGINAADYLKRFISVTMRLPDTIPGQQNASVQLTYFDKFAGEMGLKAQLIDQVQDHLKLASVQSELSLRDIEKILTRCVLLPRQKQWDKQYFGWTTLAVSLLLWQVLRPELYQSALRKTIRVEQVNEFYGIENAMISYDGDREQYNHQAYLIHSLWSYAIKGGAETDEGREIARQFSNFPSRDETKYIANVIRDFFGLFAVED